MATDGAASQSANTGYNPLYPTNVPVEDSVKEFITKFFITSDIPGMTDRWLDFFHDDARFIMADVTGIGKEEIREIRSGMWRSIKSRKHIVEKVFPASFDEVFSTDTAEFMLRGSVTYVRMVAGLAPGSEVERQVTMDWAAHAVLRRGDGGEGWGFEYYRVYLQP